jgi:hypothetical protein
MSWIKALFSVALLATLAGCAEMEQVVREVQRQPAQKGLDEQTVVAGLKEALRVGGDRTVAATSKVNGYLGNALIRIALPPSFVQPANTLRRVGFAEQVDELEVAMNRAAEKAAGEARAVLWNAVRGMSIADGFKILRGGDSAATDYFRQHTAASLHKRFQPIVHAKMEEVGLVRLYGSLGEAYLSMPFTKKSDLVDMDQYVTDRALHGLFLVLAQEEKRIREDPLARTTELLRKVFQ